jgi:hypothetical protein
VGLGTKTMRVPHFLLDSVIHRDHRLAHSDEEFDPAIVHYDVRFIIDCNDQQCLLCIDDYK